MTLDLKSVFEFIKLDPCRIPNGLLTSEKHFSLFLPNIVDNTKIIRIRFGTVYVESNFAHNFY